MYKMDNRKNEEFSDNHIHVLRENIGKIHNYIGNVYFRDQRQDWQYPSEDEIIVLNERVKNLKMYLTQFEKDFTSHFSQK